MGEGRSSERFSDSNHSAYDDVVPGALGQEAYERTQSPSDWRGGYGGVAPGYQMPVGDSRQGGAQDPNAGSTDWRGGYNQVAPGYQGQQPQPSRGDYRGGYGDVAPAFPQNPGTTGGGTRTPYGEVVPPWPPRGTVPNVPDRGGVNPDGTPRRSGGQTGSSGGLREQVDRTQPLIEQSLEPRTAFWGNNVIGGVSGGLWGPGGILSNGASYMAKTYLAKTAGMQTWVQSTREAGAPVEGTIARGKYGLASVAEKPIGWGVKGAQWWENNFGVNVGRGPLKDLQQQEGKLTARLDEMANKIKPEVDRITQKLATQGESSLSATEQASLSVHRFLKGGGLGQLPADASKVLNAAEIEEVVRYQETVKKMQPFAGVNPADFQRYVQALEAEASTAGAFQKVLTRIQSEADALTARASGGAVLTEAEQAIINTHKYLKGEATTLPQGVLAADELVTVTNHRHNVSEVKGLGADKAFAGTPLDQVKTLLDDFAKSSEKLEAMAKKIAPDAERLAAKAKTGALSAEEAAILEFHNYIKGTGQKPAAEVISKLPQSMQEMVTTAEQQVGQRGMIQARVKSLESELKAVPGGWRAFMQNFAKGMFVVGASQFVNDRLDRQIFGKFHNSSSDVIDSVVIPAAMLMPGGWLKKGAAMVGGHFAGKYLVGDWLDKQMGVSGSPSWSRFLRPTGVEAMAVAAASLIPMRNPGTFMWRRLALVGGAMLTAKFSNLLLGEESAKEKRDDAVAAFVNDKSKRSADSMGSAIEQFKDLGRANEPALKWYLGDWLTRKHDDKLNGHRGLAILFTSTGEVRLDRGTMVGQGNGKPTSNPIKRALSFKNNTVEYDNILAGYDLDLGGRALKDLASARIELNRAKEQTQIMADRGERVKDTPVKASEVAELEQVGQRIDASIARIYGRHDIPEAMKELQDWIFKLNQREADKLIRQQIKATIANPGTTDQKYIAKQYRDLALIDLAWAGVKVGYNGVGSGKDGASAAIFYQEAVAALQQARALDASNPDIAQLETIVLDLGKVIPQKESAQWNNTTFNPLGVRR